MSKFNAKKVSGPTEVNFMGESAYQLSDKEELISKVLTTFLDDGYYMKSNEITSRIIELTEKCGYEFAAKLAIYARKRANMRSASHLLASIVCRDSANTPWLREFYEDIVVRPDDMTEILSCYALLNGIELNKGSFKKIPASMKKGFAKVLSNLSPYQIDKYKMKNRSISMIDLVNLLHPIPGEKNAEAYRRLMHGESLAGTYDAKIFEKEMSETGKNANSDDELVGLKHDAIKAVLESGMPIMNLLRNLRNIMLYAPDMVDEAIKQLVNRDKIINGKLLPFRFMSAYDSVLNLTIDDYYENDVEDEVTKIKFESDDVKMNATKFKEIKNKVLKALDDAVGIACENVPELEGNCAILIDHSGSVRGDWGGSSKISKFSSVRTSHIGNLFASIVAHKQKDVYIGMFGNELISQKMKRDMGVLEFNKKTYDEGKHCGGATENGLYEFLRAAINEQKHIDNFIIFSDMEIGDGGRGGWDMTSRTKYKFQDLFSKFRKLNPNCLTVCVNIFSQSGTSVFNPNLNLLNVSGWSNAIFDTIGLYKEGKLKSMVEEIEQIKLF